MADPGKCIFLMVAYPPMLWSQAARSTGPEPFAALDALLDGRNVTAAAAMSGTLKRLRDHFADPLLIQPGRNMPITARGEWLELPIKTALALTAVPS